MFILVSRSFDAASCGLGFHSPFLQVSHAVGELVCPSSAEVRPRHRIRVGAPGRPTDPFIRVAVAGRSVRRRLLRAPASLHGGGRPQAGDVTDQEHSRSSGFLQELGVVGR